MNRTVHFVSFIFTLFGMKLEDAIYRGLGCRFDDKTQLNICSIIDKAARGGLDRYR